MQTVRIIRTSLHFEADQIFRTYSLLALTVKLELNVDPVPLAIDKAIPCGIIVNELITNSLKHAFRGQSSGTISVGMQTTAEGMLILSVGDDGVGIPEDMDLSASPSLGLKLVRTLADQLRGEVTIQRVRGMTLTIRFPSS